MRERLLDLRGLRCPWPALRVARALRDADGDLVALADDPRAGAEIGAVAAAHGWRTAALDDGAAGLRLTRCLPDSGVGNPPFTGGLA